MKKKIYTGINIQWPISTLISSGQKTIETRTYPLPKKYIGVPLALIETPGKTGKFKARVIGIVTFAKSFQYKSKEEFYRDIERHKVSKDTEWSWAKKKKWGWIIQSFVPLKKPRPLGSERGIIFRNNIEI